ncbi:MAG: hypothetical protein U9N76_08460 [Candidatus Marinimicrobia bacterium]|nr:hypothetical protein [Candidatus Neomarinimicrobiota bacterium]
MNCKTFENEYIQFGLEQMSSSAKKHLRNCKKCKNTIVELRQIDDLLIQKRHIILPTRVKKNVLNTLPNNSIFSPTFIVNIVFAIITFILFMFNYHSIVKTLISVSYNFIELINIISFHKLIFYISGLVAISLFFPISLKFRKN